MTTPSGSKKGGGSAGKKPQRRFQFIDNSDIGKTGATSTQVRRHVMQEYMREKRWENRAKTEDNGVVASIDMPVAGEQGDGQHARKRKRSSPQSRQHAREVDVPVRSPSESSQPYPLQQCTQNPLSTSITKDTPPRSVPAARQETRDTSDDIEVIPRNFVPQIESLQKSPRRGFYLTSQAFAKVADLLPATPLTPPPSISSTDSASPQTLSDGYSAYDTDGTSPMPMEPVSMLSAARTDPFDCLPMALNRQDQELFDFYATVMPACSYGFERRSPHAHNWYLSVFIPEAMKSPVAFQNTILVHAANTQAWVKKLTETPLAIEHRARASEMLSAHFQKFPLDTSDAAISSTLSAAALEDFDPRLERRQYAWLHWRAAVQKIRDRGGPAALEQNTGLRMLINWSDYIFSGYDGFGSTFFFDHTLSPQASNRHEAEVIGRKEIAQQCDELIIFLKCAEHLALVAANLQNNSIARKDQPFRYSVFKPCTPLHNLLASPNGPRYTETGQLKQIISRLAALMTINVAIWEYRYSRLASEQFFQELVENIYHNNLDLHISVEALLQILLSGSRHPNLRHTERPWLVGRMLKVAKRLSRASWERLNEFLLQCLTLGPSLAPTMHIWEHELRAEILTAPLASEVLPLMQDP